MVKVRIAPSILNSNFGHLQAEVDKIRNADILHVDIMDGHFVPNLTMGPAHLSAIKTKLPLEAHLMITNPVKYANIFMDSGAKRLIAHAETKDDIKEFIRLAHSRNAIAGIAINPETPLSKLKPYINKADFFLLMTVHPGFGGQSFIKSVLPKIKKLRSLTRADIEVDGGVNLETARLAVGSGATILVAGTFLFKSRNPGKLIEELRASAGKKISLVSKMC